ncbi:NleF caspase inhibitor [Escherichia marmotae]|uniref:NleF caspase inhibitor n=1 Tax=Escherichia marmotae TaxID=1499973 RepID=UPI0005720524|nr:NleF caspase inhibitor [Escherichia marmotae]AUT30022.1 type III effector [Escherichia marmotae]
MLPINNLSTGSCSQMCVATNGYPSFPEGVTELNDNHCLTPNLQDKLDIMFAVYASATNTKEREEWLYPEVDGLINNLMEKRASVFEVKNENTDDVKGALRKGMTTDDRDDYIRDLFLVYSLKVKIEKEKLEKGHAPCKVDAILSPHHTTELFGDLKAMQYLVEGRGNDVSPFETILVPDLTYNKGAWQIG